MDDLTELAFSDLAAPIVELVDGVHRAEDRARFYREVSGRLIAKMKKEGHTWRQLVTITGMSQSTLYRRGRPYVD